MKRHRYETLCDKRRDQIAGFWSFLFLNVLILLILWQAGDELGVIWPWLLNGIILLAALVFRPQFAVGYLVSLAGAIAVSLLYVASCWVACSGLDSTGATSDSALAAALICPALVFPAWLILAVVQSYRLYRQACRGGPEPFGP